MEVVPVLKVNWLDLVLRMDIPPQRKTVAFALAKFGNSDGTRVFPSQQKVADMAGLHETNARKHIRALTDAGMLTIVRRGGGRGGATNTYRLTRPADISTLPLWLDPDMNRVDDSPEQHASALGVSVDNSDSGPVDNPETPSAGALHSEDPAPGIPSVSAINTERLGPEYRALALGDLPKTSPRPPQNPAGSPNATPLLALVPPLRNDDESITQPEPPAIPTADDFEAGREVLATMSRAVADRWRRDAERELLAAGIPLDRRAVTIRAADLATRPDQTGT